MRVAGIASTLLAAAGLLFGTAPAARAHDFPGTVVIPPGETVNITVTGHPPCEGIISLSLNEAGKVSVNPSVFVGVASATFPVTAHPLAKGSTTLTVRWIEENAAGGNPGPCDDQGEGIITVLFSEIPSPTSAANFPSSGKTGDPVDTFTGELVLAEPEDLAPGGPMDLRFERLYASGLERARVKGSLGPNWRHNFEWTAEAEGELLVLTTAAGRVVLFGREGGEWVRSSPSDVPWQAVDHGGGVALADPAANRILEFDAAGRLAEIRDGKGGVLLLSRDGSGNLTEVRDHPDPATARALTFVHAGGRLAEVRERYGAAAGRGVAFRYGNGLLAGATDAAGNETVYEYDASHPVAGLLVRKVLPLGNAPWTQAWDGEGRVAVQADALGNAATLSWGTGKQAGTTTVTDPEGGTTLHVHGAGGALEKAVDPAGNATELETDGDGRRTVVSGSDASRGGWTWHAPSGRPSSVADGEGNVTTFTWTARTDPATGLVLYDLSRVDRPDGTAEAHTLSSAGLSVVTVDGNGEAWARTYDARGLLLSETDPEGGVTSWTRDGFGDVVSVEDPEGVVETRAYDARRRLASITRADGSVRAFGYDALDRRTTVTDETGRVFARSFDANGSLVAVVDPAGAAIAYGRDAMDRISAVTDAEGETSSALYDSRGHYAGREDRNGERTVVAVDAAGRPAEVTDAEGATWRRTFDDEGRPVESTDPAGGTVRRTFAGNGALVAVATPLGHRTDLARDALSRVVRRIDPEGREAAVTRDGEGRVTGVDLGDGVAALLGRDGAGRLVSITDPNGEVWTLARDAAGRITARTDPLGNAILYGHDDRGRLSGVTLPGGLGTGTVSYDGAGRVVARTWSDGSGSAFTLDAAGRRVAAGGWTAGRDARGLLISSNGIGIGRDAEGRVSSFTLAPGKTVTFVRDGVGRVVRVADWAGGTAVLARDSRGLPVSLARSNGVTTEWDFDADHRLVAIREGGLASTVLERNGAGQVVRADRDLPLAFSLEDAAGTSLAVDAAQRASGRIHDALGRVVSDGVRTFAWDARSRATRIEEGGEGRDFTYDAFGLVLSADDGSGTDGWTWNYGTGIPSSAILSRDGAPVRYFVFDPEGALLWSLEADGSGRRWYHFDEVGNTLFLTDDAGTVTDAFAWSPWGLASGRTGSTDTPFTWLGRWGVMDEGGGLFRMRRRLYDAATRRFLTPDPAPPPPDPRGLNPYGYALGDPLRFVDPLGEESEATQAVGLGSNVVGGVAEVVSSSADAFGGSAALGKAADGLGKAAGALGNLNEIAKADEAMDEAVNRLRKRDEEAWKLYGKLTDEAHRAYRAKRITLDQLNRFLRDLRYALHKQLESSEDEFAADSIRAVAVAWGNIAINTVPFVGFVLDAGDIISY